MIVSDSTIAAKEDSVKNLDERGLNVSKKIAKMFQKPWKDFGKKRKLWYCVRI